jgi:protein-tyrosine phosphatase
MRADQQRDPESGVAAARRSRKVVAGESTPDSRTDSLEVVFLCTGNRFRSPLAAALFAEATTGLPVFVQSAGTLNVGSPPPFAETIEHAHRFGLDISGHRARPLADQDVSAADLLVGFEHAHVAVAVIDAGVQRERAFTLPEIVQLLDLADETLDVETPSQRARLAIARADATRVAMGRTPGRPELADPVGHSRAVYAQRADEIRDLVDRLVSALFG